MVKDPLYLMRRSSFERETCDRNDQKRLLERFDRLVYLIECEAGPQYRDARAIVPGTLDRIARIAGDHEALVEVMDLCDTFYDPERMKTLADNFKHTHLSYDRLQIVQYLNIIANVSKDPTIIRSACKSITTGCSFRGFTYQGIPVTYGSIFRNKNALTHAKALAHVTDVLQRFQDTVQEGGLYYALVSTKTYTGSDELVRRMAEVAEKYLEQASEEDTTEAIYSLGLAALNTEDCETMDILIKALENFSDIKFGGYCVGCSVTGSSAEDTEGQIYEANQIARQFLLPGVKEAIQESDHPESAWNAITYAARFAQDDVTTLAVAEFIRKAKGKADTENLIKSVKPRPMLVRASGQFTEEELEHHQSRIRRIMSDCADA